MSTPGFIPFHLPSIGDEEIQEVAHVLRSGWLTTGNYTARFEQEFGDYSEAKHSLGVNSCTAALHIALAALGIGPGDEVITTPITFCATVTSILHVGATPVLADVGADGNIDPQSIADRMTSRTRAIIPVHLAGAPCDMDKIWELARKHKVFVIEDAAHAAGSWYKDRPIGASRSLPASDAVAFSFYATKNLTTGEGGMLTMGDDKLAEKARRLALHGISKDAWNRYTEKGSWKYDVLEAGFKYNLSDIQSAIGVHQLKKLESFTAIRKQWAELYRTHFQGLEEVEPAADSERGRHSWHLYILRLNLDKLLIDRNEFMVELKRQGIGASVHFIPIPQLTFFAPWADLPQNACPRALELHQRCVSLLLYPAMTEEMVEHVANTVKRIVITNRKALIAVGESA
jgi:dTDP-4-amino-4,6-dideoxygalactose transaminase